MSLKQARRVNRRLILSAACLLLIFGVGSVSAQCDLGRCDVDGDGYPKNLKGRCRDCPPPVDCDDSDPTVGPCDGGTSAVYRVELTEGAFVLEGGPVDDLLSDLQGNSLTTAATPIEMLRPGETEPDLAATWDSVFARGCPEFFNRGDFEVEAISATWDRWSIQRAGDRRFILGAIPLTDAGGVDWEIALQLIGPEGVTQPWLPENLGDTSTISLERFAIFGNELRVGPGRKSTCQPRGTRWAIHPLLPPGKSCCYSELVITRLQ